MPATVLLVVILTGVAAMFFQSARLNELSTGGVHLPNEGIGFFVEVVGGLYGILSAFVLFVVWEQFNRVNTGIMREASALDDLCEVSACLSDRHLFNLVRGSIRDYVSRVMTEEPGRLAAGNLSSTCEELWGKVVAAIRGIEPATPKDRVMYDQMLESLAAATTARDERLAVSRTRIPSTIIHLMVFAAGVLVFGLLQLNMGNPGFTGLCVGLLAGLLTFVLVVVKDIDNPFRGVWNVSYQPMRDVDKRLGTL